MSPSLASTSVLSGFLNALKSAVAIPVIRVAFLNVSDSTCSLDCVIFPESWRAYKDLLTEGNTLMISGTLDKKKESFIVQKAWQI